MQTIKRIGVFSLARLLAFIYFFLGIVFGIIFGFFILLGVVFARETSMSVFLGLGIAVMMPVFYGALGFLFGALGGVLFNWAASLIGGLQIELDS